jgi:hypothetical protein
MAKPRRYRVNYRDGRSNGCCEDRYNIVMAYDAKDAAFQGMIEPERHQRANAANCYVYLLSVEPWPLGKTKD